MKVGLRIGKWVLDADLVRVFEVSDSLARALKRRLPGGRLGCLLVVLGEMGREAVRVLRVMHGLSLRFMWWRIGSLDS